MANRGATPVGGAEVSVVGQEKAGTGLQAQPTLTTSPRVRADVDVISRFCRIFVDIICGCIFAYGPICLHYVHRSGERIARFVRHAVFCTGRICKEVGQQAEW